MNYIVEIDNRAKKEIKKLNPNMRKQIMDKLHLLQFNPRPANSIKLTNSDNLFRIRCGSFRIIYQIQDKKLLVLIVKVGHRLDVYKDYHI